MNAPARARTATPILRTATGEPPLGIGGLAFRDDQGEMFFYDRNRSPSARIGVLELEDGLWLAHPPGFLVEGARFADRNVALRSAIARLIRKARRNMRAKEDEGTHWSEGFGGRVIEWALSLKPAQRRLAAEEQHPILRDTASGNDVANGGASAAPRSLLKQESKGERENDRMWGDKPGSGLILDNEEITPAANDANDLTGKTTVEEITDPVVAELVAAHRARKEFPAGHTFAMTNPEINGRMVTLGTCSCGDVFSYPYGSAGHERMDAAIEAHWQTVDALSAKVDGRGKPINAEDGSAGSSDKHPSGDSSSKKRRRRSAPKTGNTPELANAALPEPASVTLSVEDAGSSVPVSAPEGLAAPAPASSSSAVSEGAGASDIADVPQHPRSEPAPEAPPDGAGSLIQEAAPIGAASVADVKCQACEPAQICAGSTEVSEPPEMRLAAPGFRAADPVRETGLHGGLLALSDDEDLAIEWPSYDSFLEDKIVTAPLRGIEVNRDDLHPWLKPHCKDLTLWALRLGCAAIFANFGLHKTAMQLEWCRQLHRRVGGATLNVVPLGVRHGFIKEAVQLGMDVRFIRTDAEFHALSAEGVVHFLTNYESIREGKLNPNLFAACSLDEASVLRSYGSKTFQEFLPLFAKVMFKLVATATPSPNRYKELIHYAGFLGVMDTGLALTRWFQRNSEKAGDLTLYPHKADEFWMWIHSYCAFLQRPSELGHSDEGYELPPLKLIWREVPADHSKAAPERDGQGVMFRKGANGLQEAAKSRRDSLPSRIAALVETIAQDPEGTWLIWHDLEAERIAIEQALPDVVTIHGGMDIDEREIRLHDFEEGRIKKFATKPILSGSGSNFQYHCHKAIYVGMPGDGYKFNDFIQSLYRLQRFGQTELVEVWIIYSEDMRAGRASLEQKWALDTEMRKRMSAIILAHGLNTLPLRDALARTMGIKRVEIRGQSFVAINNDCVAECRAWADNSVDQIITSIPFSNHYEYSASYRDFGHTDDNGHFWGQMDFLTAELLRMLKPGRLACIHVKDRVLFGSVTGEGVSTISPFHAEAIMHYRAHGFQYMGMHHINTDVVTENANGSYRLGWSENCKDSTTKGCGSPEYVLLLRKRQSDRTRGYADVPVTKEKWNGDDPLAEPNDGYSRARWQIDAHAFWRTNGNRFLTPEEFAGLGPKELVKVFTKLSRARIYDYEAHVKIGEALERVGQLPAEWMCCAPGATDENTWDDIVRMHTLNTMQAQKGREKHICPLQFEIVDRCINRFSNEGDLIFDPFGGLMTVPYRAILKGRRGAGVELSPTYFLDGVKYCQMAEEKLDVPVLFDLATFDAVNTPPLPTDTMEVETSDG